MVTMTVDENSAQQPIWLVTGRVMFQEFGEKKCLSA
jgi:hypothetical protein